MPLILFALSILPRVWEPDLIPFGAQQAAALADAVRPFDGTSPTELIVGRADRVLVRLLTPAIGLLPSPLEAWVALRALLDGLVTVLLFVAVRRLAGTVAGAFTALVYAASPWGWALVRDPAAPAPPVVLAVVLLLATRVNARSSPLLAGALGFGAGLLAAVQPLGWLFVPALASALALARASALSLVSASAWLLVGAGVAAPAWVALGTSASGWVGVDGTVDRPFAGVDTLGHVLAGLGVEDRLVGVATLSDATSVLQQAALACGAALLVLGVWRSLGLARGGASAALVPSLWLVAALVAIVLHERRVGAEELAALLPVGAALVGMACTSRGVGRWSQWPALVGATLVVLFGAGTIGSLSWSAATLAQAAASRPYGSWAAGEPARDGRSTGPLSAASPSMPTVMRPLASYRFWTAVAAEGGAALARTGGSDLLVVGAEGVWSDAARIVESIDSGSLVARQLPGGSLVLPVEGEATYLVLPDVVPPPELAWPSARLGSVPLAPTDRSAHVVTLRPRPQAHWSVLHGGGSEIRFADGSTLVATRVGTASAAPSSTPTPSASRSNAGSMVELLWLVPRRDPAATSSFATTALLATQRDGAASTETRVTLPAPPSGTSEMVIQRVALADRTVDGPTLTLRLLGPAGEPIRAVSGQVDSTGAVEVTQAR